jgi:DNA helicase-2/ATP-dependent DNA helicase PcrA
VICFKELLNPLNRRVPLILDFEKNPQRNTDNPLINEELDYLKKIVEILGEEALSKNERLDKIRKELEDIIYIIENTTGDDKSEAVGDYNKHFKRAKMLIKLLNRILSQLNQPYFGKVIFDRKDIESTKPIEGKKKEITTYFGKFAYFDKDTNKMLVTDWRAPIANVYYKNTGPTNDIHFKSPVGKQIGDLVQKRQFEISEGRINNIYEARTGNAAADAFLLSQLTQRVGKKLQDIVSTIQEEQNEIIRDQLNQTTVLQGVAGSGKTTILLHRIAYLLFTYKEELKAEKMLIIAPNKMFLDYISDVLPSLGVDEIGRNTYISWAKDILNWDEKFSLSTGKEDLTIKRLKGSKKFIKLIELYIEQFERDLFEKMPDDPLRFIIENRYEYMKAAHPELDMSEQLQLSLEYAFAQLQFKNKTTGDFMGRLEMQKKRQSEIQSYFTKRLNPLKIYRDLYRVDSIFKEAGFDTKTAKALKKYTLEHFKKAPGGIQKFKVEDLPPMLNIHLHIYGKKDHIEDYIVVDEAQDLSPYQIKTLHSIAKNGNLLIAGDIAQSIVPPFYFEEWNELEDVLDTGNKEIKYYHLKRCYRTTVEIIEYANELFKGKLSERYRPEAVLRHGDEVIIKEFKSEDEKINSIINIVRESVKAGASTTALLTKDYNSADKLFETLEQYKDEKGRNISEIFEKDFLSYKSSDYKSGILVMPIEKAKGLEFDSVVITDRDSYDLNKTLDVRLLYVAITRALHRVIICKRV